MEVFFLAMIFILGLCFGSFVNMLVYRIAINYKLVERKFEVKNGKRSFCDGCGKQLKWYENIPVIFWVYQRGKTRCCHKKLPVLYPIVEGMMGILFLVNSFKFITLIDVEQVNGLNILVWILSLVIIVFLVFSGVFDLKYMILPDFSTVILIIIATIFWLFYHYGEWNYLSSAFLSFGFLGFLYFITKKKGMGFGDVKLAFFMGLFLGWPNIIVAFYIAFIVGAVISLILIIFKKAGRKTQIPFGPFLILGTLVAWSWGEVITLSIFQFIR